MTERAEIDVAALELAALVLGEVSPEEAPLVDALGPDLLDAAQAGPGEDGSLGFGGLETVLAVAVVAVSKIVLEYVVEVGKDLAVNQGSSWVGRLVAGLRSKRQGEVPAAELLSATELDRVRDVAFTSALGLGIEESRARLLADAMGGALGFAPPGAAAVT